MNIGGSTHLQSAVSQKSIPASSDALISLAAKSDVRVPVDGLQSSVNASIVNAAQTLKSPSASEQQRPESLDPPNVLQSLQAPLANSSMNLKTEAQSRQSGSLYENSSVPPAAGDQRARQNRIEAFNESRQTEQNQASIRQLAARDRDVRNHERAHVAIGGKYAGPISFSTVRGVDGITYAVGGEVSISVGEIAGNPEATIRKAQQVQRAALAPADASSADRQVAARAAQIAVEARSQILQLKRTEALAEAESADQRRVEKSVENESVAAPQTDTVSTVATESKAKSIQANEKSDENENSTIDLDTLNDARRRSFANSQKLLELGLTTPNNDIGSIISEVI